MTSYTKFNTAGFIRDLVDAANAPLTMEQLVDAVQQNGGAGLTKEQIAQSANSLVSNPNPKLGKTIDGKGFVPLTAGASADERRAYRQLNKKAPAAKTPKAPRVAGGKPKPEKYTVAQLTDYLTEQFGQPVDWKRGDPMGHPVSVQDGHTTNPEAYVAQATRNLGHEPTGWYQAKAGDYTIVGLL